MLKYHEKVWTLTRSHRIGIGVVNIVVLLDEKPLNPPLVEYNQSVISCRVSTQMPMCTDIKHQEDSSVP